MINKKKLNDFDFNNKKVLVRVDFNVPLQSGEVSDDNRLIEALPTIRYLLENNAKVILLSHLGRVKTAADKKSKTLSPIAKRLEKLLNQKVMFIDETRGSKLEVAINNLNSKEIILMENTRFEDLNNNAESKNNPELGKYWASLGDIFVNDAFGTAHRAHASNVGIAKNIKYSCIGFLIEKEVDMLSKVLYKPAKPVVAIIGGAKVSDKIELINSLLKVVDKLIIGGGMAYTFLKAKNINIGKSLVELDKVPLAEKYLLQSDNKIILPIDFATTKDFANTKPIYTKTQSIDNDYMSLDIGPKSIELFTNELKNAKTVIWNGPLGVFEMSNYSRGTTAICQTIANLRGAFTVIGGGDSAAAAIQLGFKNQFSHISTGGGACLEFLEGKVLPGIESINNA